ncbi:hypothetical protein [Xanthocytophaga agilis]|uniref:Lipocalin-like domain-containing protein n=1 Tax=Xanthocytophaga agilis TaxID=3048010 RepID=A0AAE3RDA1_9BACT|nr:hypothetical protein [Xanthocytophaga agilis]MDJ1506500.1 hypothetical protein [Xanthocytophaga agilis]
MNTRHFLLLILVSVLSGVLYAQTPTSGTATKIQPSANANLKIDPKLRVNPAFQKLSGTGRKRWVVTAINRSGYKIPVESGSCYADNELILSSDLNASYSEGTKLCVKSMPTVPDLHWQISSDGKKLTLSGLPVMKEDNSNAMIGFLLGSDAEVLELTETTLRLRFQGIDGYISGKFAPVTNEITYTAK